MHHLQIQTSTNAHNLVYLGRSQAVHTLITVANCIEVDVIVVVAEEHQAKPRIERIDRHDEQYADYPALFIWAGVIAKVLIDLKQHNLLTYLALRFSAAKMTT